jgi:spermidine synthase
VWRFYEIDPQVVAVTRAEVSFLADSPARVEIVLGDGRLSLEREADQHFDLLAIDAFSGDSIPMHLLTREAMQTYVRHIQPGGAIVFQATNRFVDIAPVVERLAALNGMTAVMVSDWPDSDPDGPGYWLSGTDQIVVSRSSALLGARPIASAAQPLAQRPDFRVWSDDFYNLLRILKW